MHHQPTVFLVTPLRALPALILLTPALPATMEHICKLHHASQPVQILTIPRTIPINATNALINATIVLILLSVLPVHQGTI